MIDLHSHELWQLVGLLFGVGVLLVLAPVLRIPYPILLVLGGLALAFVPGLPEFELRPEVILLGFLPPLLYSSAFFTSVRDLRANLRPVSLLAIGLVAATMVGVAAVAHWLVDDLTWPAAFVLGAIVSPTDPIAATSIGRRLGRPAPPGHRDRERKPLERCERARLLPDRGRRDGRRHVLAVGGGRATRPQRGRRDRDRAGGRLRRASGAQAPQRPADGDHGRAPHRVPRVPAGGGARSLGGARRGHGRPLHGLVHARAHERRDPSARRGLLDDPDVHPQRGALRARRAPDPARARPARRLVDERARAVGDGGLRGGDPDPARLGVPARVRPALPVEADQGARSVPDLADPARARVGGDARRRVARRRARDPADDERRRAASPDGTSSSSSPRA